MDEDKNGADQKFVHDLYLLVRCFIIKSGMRDEVCWCAQDTTLQVSTEFLLKYYLT